MPRPLKRGIIGASTIILSKDINKYVFMCGSNFYESDVINQDGLLFATLQFTSIYINCMYHVYHLMIQFCLDFNYVIKSTSTS